MKAFLIITILVACSLMSVQTPFPFRVPKGFPPPVYKFENNPLTKAGFELGRKLFYDGQLSKDGDFPCSSCHQQYAAFSTYEHRLSHGFNNQFSARNAPGLFNLAWEKEFHWDGSINHLEVQPLAPMLNPREMAEKLDQIIYKLNQDKEYPALFNNAFGSPGINTKRLLLALAQFTVSLVSADSKYDKMKRGEAVFNKYEKTGYGIFQQKCEGCHKEPLFTDLSYRNTGLEVDSTLLDYGRMHVTGKKEDSLKFKVPSLRNVFLTSPYGHDGRFSTISDMLEHYNKGVIQSATLDTALRKGIALTDNDKFYLIQFLGTLTDTAFVNNPLYKDPALGKLMVDR